MMSAVGELHKLYASTAPPIVWARNTGLEVLNELDAFNPGIHPRCHMWTIHCT
ncbi:hypothetical protein BGW80DRAFT_1307716 [Lactifluus volemus]|nr:hypothetical protein BGW80DRAFT_1307716 [Lactifluus volemus]